MEDFVSAIFFPFDIKYEKVLISSPFEGLEMRFLFSLLAVLTLSACNFNVTPQFYFRDVQDVMLDNQPIDIPIFLKIPASDVDSCNSEIGQVLGILMTHGMDGTLLSCSTDEDNFFAVANVKFTASVVPSKFSQEDNFVGIFALIVEDAGDGVYYLNLQANPKLPKAMSDIENALFFATLDASQVGFVITLNNDTRRLVELNIYDSFVNGIPTDYGSFEIGPRSQLEIRSSDVGANLFFDRGWFGVADLKM